MTSTSAAGHRLDPIQTTNLSLNTAPVEMDDLDTAKNSKLVSGTSGLLNDISIPETSPITSDYPSYPSNSSVLPTTPTTTTKTTNPTTEMVDSSKQNASIGDGGSTSQEALTAQPVTNEETSSIDPAPAPPPTMSKSEGKAPATESSSDAQESLTSRPRMNSEAIGPSLEITKTPPPPADGGPRILITLLLTSGARHPYKIDEKYLTKRSVAVPGVTENGKKDPLTISVYTLKELILREWRDEWETKPSSPTSIRLIFFGRLLDDKDPLKACKFNPETSNVVHMTIRPQDIVDEEDASKAKSMGRGRGEDGESNAGCRCVVL
ncbi:hypothetical protein BOTNAR_0450g00010 [Botryotinia narcissicola]|uniref:Ubiquitin-like domain-containing protein n=1 Tax=Botryotinia narcissicola TaxID=278944 RepID=A0A4Z1HIV7_9HELO|nr:hypothetical protein BOTNAR_0450g00010 [Botryotinia narcissicola]